MTAIMTNIIPSIRFFDLPYLSVNIITPNTPHIIAPIFITKAKIFKNIFDLLLIFLSGKRFSNKSKYTSQKKSKNISIITSNYFSSLQRTPYATTLGGIDFVTTLPALMTALSPIVTPLKKTVQRYVNFVVHSFSIITLCL